MRLASRIWIWNMNVGKRNIQMCVLMEFSWSSWRNVILQYCKFSETAIPNPSTVTHFINYLIIFSKIFTKCMHRKRYIPKSNCWSEFCRKWCIAFSILCYDENKRCKNGLDKIYGEDVCRYYEENIVLLESMRVGHTIAQKDMNDHLFRTTTQ